nr:MAG TPA: hypothetical protein [Caudoviricetes sp.]
MASPPSLVFTLKPIQAIFPPKNHDIITLQVYPSPCAWAL